MKQQILKLELIEQAHRRYFNQKLKLTEKDQVKKQSFLLKLQLFNTISQKRGNTIFKTIVKNLRMVKIDFGETIFEGKQNRTFNYVVKGVVMLFVRDRDHEEDVPKFYSKIGVNQHFGEKLQLGKEELYSARAVSCSYLLQLDLNILYPTFAGYFQFHQIRGQVNFLNQIWVFANLKRTVLERIILMSQTKKFNKNSLIFKEKQKPQSVFVIVSGQLTLFNMQEKQKIKFHPFSIVSRGQICGVEQMINKQAFSYSGMVVSQCCEILIVQKNLFLQVTENEINQQTLEKRKKLHGDLKRKSNSPPLKIKKKQQNIERQQNITRRFKTENYSSELNNKDDKKRVQLFPIELDVKRIRHRHNLTQKRQQNSLGSGLSEYTNSYFTYDKQIIVKYLRRKQKDLRKSIMREKEFNDSRIPILKELFVTKSSAVKNQKRKLKESRKNNTHFYL